MTQTIAYYATLFTHNRATTGVAMRTPDRRVWFRTEHTGLWQELTDVDAPDLHLHGRLDLVQQAALVAQAA